MNFNQIQEMVLVIGGLLFLALFVWYLAAVEKRSRLQAGMWLSIVSVALFTFAIFPLSNIRLGIDLRGGASFLMELTSHHSGEQALDQAVEVIRKRVDKFGVAEPIIQPVGDRRILVQVPALDQADKDQFREQLQKVAKLEFRLVHPQSDTIIEDLEASPGMARVPDGYLILTNKTTHAGTETQAPILVSEKVEVAGKHVQNAGVYLRENGEPAINVVFNSEGQKIFGEMTSKNVGNRMAIVLDGEVRSAPVIREAIYKDCSIDGAFTFKEAAELASVLENPLETPVAIIEERDVSASLGSDSIKQGIQASLLAGVLVLGFTLIYYRLAGLIAVIALFVNTIVLLGLLAQLKFTLTLPGIAGMILNIGMAVDASVLIYERIREEIGLGKALTPAIHSGFDKAFSSIVDANLTTIITSIILFYMGSGPVQGFAITITLGIFGTLFAALIVSRHLFEWLDESKKIKQLNMMQLVGHTNFDFMKYRVPAICLSALVIAAGLALFVSRGDKALGVDFSGGDAIVLKYEKAPDLGAVRQAVGGDVTVQTQEGGAGQPDTLLLRTRFGEGERVATMVKDRFPDSKIEIGSKDAVGPVVGNELKWRSVTALTLGLLGILVYVTWRFEFSFAIGAIVALLHDVAITVAFMTLLGHEMSLIVVGAVLALAGYSINDTIVVFDRVRETLRGPEKGSLNELLNQALNQMLARTLLTAGTTLLSVIALMVAGGPVIFPFALALFIGILAGTYSSVFIACPIVAWWTRGRTEMLRRQLVREDRVIPV